VRCEWSPEEGDARLNPLQARRRARFHLQEGVAERLQAGRRVRWTLEVQLAGPDDDPHDPSAHWPSERPRFDAGTLELTEAVPDPEAGGGVVVFDPMRLIDGIEPSDDPVLRFRPGAYAVSVERRTA
jgi:catalase